MRAALIRDDVAENIIEAGDGYDPPDGYTLEWLEEGQFVGPGWRLTDGDWIPPDVEELPTPEPSETELLRADLDWLINFVVTGEA